MRHVIEHVDLLIFLASRYPAYVSTDDIAFIIDGRLRTGQRVMKVLADEGYVDVIRSHPLSYRINPDKFEVFKNLEGK